MMQTPSFVDNRARPQPKCQETPQTSKYDSKKNISSVFSPIPCKPQSICSIFGVRGDNHTPYTPFNRNQLTPKKSPINTDKILRQVALATQGQQQASSNLQIFHQGSRMSNNKITPGQLLITAQPQNTTEKADDRTKKTD